MRKTGWAALALTAAVMVSAPRDAAAQAPVRFIGMGDSIGEAVQSADASAVTQGYSYINLIAWRMGAPMPLPIIRTGWFATVGDTSERSRVDPSVRTLNLAVNGADVHSLIHDRADATTVAQINSETDLVLFPRLGSQLEIAETLRPEYAAVWIGNNDALAAVTSYNQLDASQLTPLPDFTTDFTEIVTRLEAMGTKAVFATVPDVTSIALVLNGDDVARFIGPHQMPAGHLTTVFTMMLIRLGFESPSVLANPNYTLDPQEQQAISQHILAINNVIRTVAAAHDMPVVDIHAIYNYLAASPISIAGYPLTHKFLGGLFSLDGVHPSNIGQALVAYFFIEAFNQHYGAGIPQIDGGALAWIVQNDPFVDRDGDGRVNGRFGAGLVETLFNLVGVAGDSD